MHTLLKSGYMEGLPIYVEMHILYSKSFDIPVSLGLIGIEMYFKTSDISRAPPFWSV